MDWHNCHRSSWQWLLVGWFDILDEIFHLRSTHLKVVKPSDFMKHATIKIHSNSSSSFLPPKNNNKKSPPVSTVVMKNSDPPTTSVEKETPLEKNHWVLGALPVQETLTQMWTEMPKNYVMKSNHHSKVSHHTSGFDEFQVKSKEYWDQLKAAKMQNFHKKDPDTIAGSNLNNTMPLVNSIILCQPVWKKVPSSPQMSTIKIQQRRKILLIPW